MAGMSRPSSSSDENLGTDRISSLPWNVLDIILRKVTLTEAVRTSVLAKDWRYKWLSLSEFVFDNDAFSESLNHGDDWSSVVSLINNFLLNRGDPLKKFSLTTFCASHNSDVYQWIHFLSRNHVEVFQLEECDEAHFLMPSHLFAFKHLKILLLAKCSLRIPSSFGEFSWLSQMILVNVIISDDDLERLILSCPYLRHLTLLCVHHLKHLKIRSPSLRSLLTDYGFEDIVIEGNLAIVNFATPMKDLEDGTHLDWHSVIRALSGQHSLSTLGLGGGLIKLMAADDGLVRYPLKTICLTSLYIHYTRYESVEEFRVLLSLLSSSPIKTFSFSVESAKGPRLILRFLNENRGRFCFRQLRQLIMIYNSGMGSALNFVEFVSTYSPNLAKVYILKQGKIDLSLRHILGICSRVKKCRPQASVLYLPAGSDLHFSEA